TISALPSMTRRSARRMGTIVSGSNDAFSARQPRITRSLQALCDSSQSYARATAPTRDRAGDTPVTASSATRRRLRIQRRARALGGREPRLKSIGALLYSTRERRIRIEQAAVAHEGSAGDG